MLIATFLVYAVIMYVWIMGSVKTHIARWHIQFYHTHGGFAQNCVKYLLQGNLASSHVLNVVKTIFKPNSWPTCTCVYH